jgi:hypothetical protein
MLADRYDAERAAKRAGASGAAYSRRYLLTGMLRCGTCGARMVADTTIRRKASGTYQQAWYYCPASRTKGPTVCTHRIRYRKDELELRLVNRATEAMKAKNLAALADAVDGALRRAAARSKLRVALATAEADVRRAVRRDVPAAKAAIMGLLGRPLGSDPRLGRGSGPRSWPDFSGQLRRGAGQCIAYCGGAISSIAHRSNAALAIAMEPIGFTIDLPRVG